LSGTPFVDGTRLFHTAAGIEAVVGWMVAV
jgi:hypothetical protein